ncbi:ABC transporter permease [Riemerella columbipharyngis]|uniref:ABC-2 type transport system permease protein n=1 Tax=Riemerella columbipharyngis TaxID=1071918 RepID=A0A1G6YCK5_9FLAO|nr:ABC transporter permease [Riemerella columbipharyngis]SDD88109.1 ABC-2 type transport system permease protein [Riemerella columbipharyngis]
MKNIFIITKREFLTQVKKKSFLILTILAPLLLIGFGGLIGMIFKANETQHGFLVIDKNGIFQKEMKAPKDITFTYVSEADEPALKKNLETMDSIDGLLIIPALINNDYNSLEQNTQLLINKKISYDVREKIANAMTKVIKNEKIKTLGITQNQLEDLDKSFEIKTKNILEKDKEDDTLAFSVKTVMSMVLMYITFMFILMYGVRVMRSVLEEKNNRVVEIIISSVKPFELMAGKILGVTLVAITQFVIWIAMTVSAALVINNYFGSATNLQNLNAENPLNKMNNFTEMLSNISHTLLDLDYMTIIVVFLLFFLWGYIFYSSMYAAIGSAVDNETETQQFSLFTIMPLMIGMYGSFSIAQNPDGPMGFWLSMIPFTSPVAMIARIPFGVPVWQIILSISILIAFTVLMVFIASKIYRVGILMHGNKASWKQLLKWIKA